MSADSLDGERDWLLCFQLTFRKQELHGAQVTLAGGHHEQGPALLVAHIYISTMLQQQLRDLRDRNTQTSSTAGSVCSLWQWRELGVLKAHFRAKSLLGRRTKWGTDAVDVRLTCQCPCLTAQNRGETPRRLTCCTTAPCSNRKLHTSIFPRPAAAVKAEEKTHTDVSSN